MIVFGEVVLVFFICLGNHLGLLMTTNLATGAKGKNSGGGYSRCERGAGLCVCLQYNVMV